MDRYGKGDNPNDKRDFYLRFSRHQKIPYRTNKTYHSKYYTNRVLESASAAIKALLAIRYFHDTLSRVNKIVQQPVERFVYYYRIVNNILNTKFRLNDPDLLSY